MKKILFYSFAILLCCFSSCNKKMQTAKEKDLKDSLAVENLAKCAKYFYHIFSGDNDGITTDSASEFDYFNKSRIFIKYRQTVNGYTVKVMCMLYNSPYDKERVCEIWGEALLYFEKEDSKFCVYNESFSDSILYYENKREPKDGLTLILDYLPKKEDEYLSHNSPFFFSDMDFDGEEELVINNWRRGVRYSNTYDVYKINGCQLRQLTDIPFYKISNHNTEFNPMDKSITLNSYEEWNDSISLIYKEIRK